MRFPRLKFVTGVIILVLSIALGIGATASVSTGAKQEVQTQK